MPIKMGTHKAPTGRVLCNIATQRGLHKAAIQRRFAKLLEALCTHTYMHIHISLFFPTDTRSASQNPYRDMALQSP